MSGAVCPACGIAVVPGYVRCPKCHKPLPRFARNSISPVGGTVVEQKNNNGIFVAAGVALVFIGALVAHHFLAGGKSAAVAAPASVAAPAQPQPVVPTPSAPAALGPEPVVAPVVHAEDVARALKSRLDKQRLWSTVQVIGDHVDLRSAACGDAGMKPAIEQTAAQFHAAGLTRLRCLEQSGAVVFSRAL